MWRSVAVLISLLVIFRAADAAAIRPHPRVSYEPTVSLTPHLGGVWFDDDFLSFTGYDEVSDGIIGIDLGVRVVEGLGIGFEIAGVPVSQPDVFGRNRGGDVLFLNFTMFYDIETRSPLSPFITAGMGRMEFLNSISPDFGYTSWLFGGGVKARLHPHAGLRFDVRHTRTFLEGSNLNNWQLRGGVSLSF